MSATSDTPRPRIALIVTSVLQVRWFMMGHLKLLAERFDVTVLLRNDFPDELAELALPVRIIEIPIVRKISPIADIITLVVLIRILNREQFDLVHTITPKAGLLGMIAAFFAGPKLRVHTFQGELWAHRTGFMRRLLRWLDTIVGSLATNVTIVSRSELAFLEAEGVLPVGKAKVLGAGSIGGIDVKRFRPNPQLRQAQRSEMGIPADHCTILFVGRLCADKGLPTLAEAMKPLLQERQNVHLVVVGPDEEGMESLLQEKLGELAGRRLRIMPFTRTPESFMAAADMLVLPSLREGFGVVILEAAAMGVPSIGSNIYGIQDAIVDNETGMLFTVGDANDLRAKMLALIDNPELRDALGQNARDRAVRCFSDELILTAFGEFYNSLQIGGDRK